MLDRVLRGEHREERIELARRSIDGDLPFAHRLEQRRLRFGRRAIDFVSQENLREHRTRLEFESARRITLHRYPRDIRGHEIGRELNAREVQAECARERADEQCLRGARHSFDQQVSAREKCDERVVDGSVLADDARSDRRTHLPEKIRALFDGEAHFKSA